MSIQIGINPLTWTNDDLPSLGAETPLETCLSEGKQAGYAGFELGNKFPRDAKALKALLAKYELNVVSGWFSGKLLNHSFEEEKAAIQNHLALLRDSGSTVMVYCEVTDCIHGDRTTPLFKRPHLDTTQWEKYGKSLTQLAEYCLSEGVQIAYHHHMGTVVETQEEIDLLMEHTGDAVGLLLDTGHLTFAGGDPIALIRKHGHRIKHVHCKDIRKVILDDAKNRNLSFLDAVLNGAFTVPGDGDVDFYNVFLALKEFHYKGWLVVEAEQDQAVAPPLEMATLGANTIKVLCDKVQLK